LSAAILTSEALRADRRPAEVALLARALLDETIIVSAGARRCLSVAAIALLELLDDEGASARAAGLSALACAHGLEHESIVLAAKIDAVRVAELAAVGSATLLLAAFVPRRGSVTSPRRPTNAIAQDDSELRAAS